MSVEAVSWALKQQVVTDAGARFVLVGLANHAHDCGRHSFPSIETLMSYTGLSRRSVIRKLKMLEDAGLIRMGNQAIAAAHIERADRRPTVYDLAVELGNFDSQKRGVTVTRRPERGVTQSPTGCQPVTNGVSPSHERGVTVTPEPSVKTSVKPSLKKHGGAREPAAPPNVSEPAWADYVDHRKAKGARLTDRAVELLTEKLAPLTADQADACLRLSVENGWTGVFPERVAGKQGRAAVTRFSDQNYDEGVNPDGTFC